MYEEKGGGGGGGDDLTDSQRGASLKEVKVRIV